MLLNKITYKNFKVEINVWEDGTFSAKSRHLSTAFYHHIDGAIQEIKKNIDDFIKDAPKTWEELTSAIEDALIWDSYEDCHLEVDTVKIIIENFNKIREEK